MSGKEKTPEIRIRTLRGKAYTQLCNMAEYNGLDLADYVKLLLVQTINNTPEHIKEYKKEEDN